jgi:hypothetical protein
MRARNLILDTYYCSRRYAETSIVNCDRESIPARVDTNHTIGSRFPFLSMGQFLDAIIS